MATLELVAGVGGTPLALRRRPDLEYRSLGPAGARYWRVKDPLTLKHFELGEEEFFVLERLDGKTSAEQIQADCARRFAPRELALGQLMGYIGRLHRDGLVLAENAGQGRQLVQRAAQRQRSEWLWSWTRVLGMRWRGIDPDAFLTALNPFFRWVLAPWAVSLGLLWILIAVVLVAVKFDAVRLRLPEFQAFVSLSNAPWLALSVVAAKVLHELGHAVACKRQGGECHELGVMLLVFLPCLYCNVSDAWMFASRWRRAAVGAAGMYVELLLAATCTFLWWFSGPGWFNSICFNLMVVCSVSTLAFNANPLLRYDGYFILSDLLDVPNLHERAAGVLQRGLTRWFVAAEPARENLFAPRSTYWLATYALASLAYRLFASVAIVWCAYQVLKPYHLELAAWLLATLILAALLAATLQRLGRFLGDPYWSRKLHWPRVLCALLLVALLGYGVWNFPLPHRVYVPAVVEPDAAPRVFVGVSGTLASAVAVGDRVEAGQTLAELTNRDMEFEITKLRGELEVQQIKLANLERQQVAAPAAASEIPTAREALADLEQRLAQRVLERRRLTLLAPQSGIVLPARHRDSPVTRGELPKWSGNPLEPENRGCHLETGALVCRVGDPARLAAVLLVDEDQVEFVEVGQPVQLLLDQATEVIVNGKIIELAEVDLQEAPPELIERSGLPTRPDSGGGQRTVRTYYQARVELTAPYPRLILGATGQAKIVATPLSLGDRLVRFVTGTFRFQL